MTGSPLKRPRSMMPIASRIEASASTEMTGDVITSLAFMTLLLQNLFFWFRDLPAQLGTFLDLHHSAGAGHLYRPARAAPRHPIVLEDHHAGRVPPQRDLW